MLRIGNRTGMLVNKTRFKYSKTCVKWPLSMGFQDQSLLNAGQKSSTFIKLPFDIKSFVLSIFEWPFTQVLLYVLIIFTQDIWTTFFADWFLCCLLYHRFIREKIA